MSSTVGFESGYGTRWTRRGGEDGEGFKACGVGKEDRFGYIGTSGDRGAFFGGGFGGSGPFSAARWESLCGEGGNGNRIGY